MRKLLPSLLLTALAAGLLYSGTVSAEEKSLSKADVEAIVKQVISDNPDLIISSVENYQRKKMTEDTAKASKTIVERQTDLKNDSSSPYAGNPNGDVTIVEFFDYHCGYCKQFLPVVTELLSEDPKLKLVFKEFPILAEDSSLAAKAALAVYNIDKSKYLAYHTALMKMSGSFTMDNLTEKAKSIGIDASAFKKEMENPALEKQIDKNRELAYSLNIHGTPAIIVGDELIPGVIPMNELKSKIAELRAKK